MADNSGRNDRDRRGEWRRDYRYDRRGHSISGGFWLLVIGCVLIALGLSFGGEWAGSRWWPWKTGPFSFGSAIEHDGRGDGEMRKLVTTEGDVSAGVRALDIDLKGATLVIRRGTNPSWTATDFEEGSIEVDTAGDTFRVRAARWRDSFPFGNLDSEPRFELVLPADASLIDCSIKLGAGAVTIEELRANTFRLEGGAGSFRAKGFSADNATVKTGAGLVELDDATVRDLRVETGAGRIVLRGDITGSADISTGTGSVEFTLAGSEDDYRFTFARGLGSVRIGSDSWDGMGDGVAGNEGADRLIKLSTGIGSVRIDFAR